MPLTLYNKYKGMCEPLLFKHQSPDFTCVTIRPATVCGYCAAQAARPVGQHPDQPRRQQRQDHGVRRRPEAPQPAHPGHVSTLYELLLDVPDEKIAGETFNVGFQNHDHHGDRARSCSKVVERGVSREGRRSRSSRRRPTTSARYHVNSRQDRGACSASCRKRTVEDAVRDLCRGVQGGQAAQQLRRRSVLQRPDA